MKTTVPMIRSPAQTVRSSAVLPNSQPNTEPAALTHYHLQQAADRSPQTQQLRQLQALADQRVPQLAAMEEDEPPRDTDAEKEEPFQGKFGAGLQPVQRQEVAAPNQTGMPASLKSGIESLSGMDMSSVRVHRNSAEPAKVGAHAYAQGTNIHLASGQDRHLPHEAWHVVQQAQGRVQPTRQAKGIAINDDTGLEREADAMGAKATQLKKNSGVGRLRRNR